MVDTNEQKGDRFASIYAIASRISKESSSETSSKPFASLTNKTWSNTQAFILPMRRL